MKTRSSVFAAAACALLLAVPLVAAGTSQKAAKNAASQNAWRPETLTGKIVSVDPGANLVVVKTPGGVPFDFDITKHTRIDASSHAVTLKDLMMDLNKQVSVSFVPERRGDVAKSIQING